MIVHAYDFETNVHDGTFDKAQVGDLTIMKFDLFIRLLLNDQVSIKGIVSDV